MPGDARGEHPKFQLDGLGALGERGALFPAPHRSSGGSVPRPGGASFHRQTLGHCRPRRPGGTAARPQGPRCSSGGADSPGRTRCLSPLPRRSPPPAPPAAPAPSAPDGNLRIAPAPGTRRTQRASLSPAPALPACPPHAPAAAALPPRGSPARPGSSSSFLSAHPPSLPHALPPAAGACSPQPDFAFAAPSPPGAAAAPALPGASGRAGAARGRAGAGL